MATTQRMHEAATVPPSAEHIRAKAADGWRLSALVWERDTAPGDERTREVHEVVPFGLRVADDCVHLVDEPSEKQIILLSLELIVQDYRLSQVAQELNRRGFRTRSGTGWNAASVFNLLPRLIDAGSRVFSSEEWVERRQHLFQSIQQ